MQTLFNLNRIFSIIAALLLAVTLCYVAFSNTKDPNISITGLSIAAAGCILTAFLLYRRSGVGLLFYILMIQTVIFSLIVGSIVDGAYLGHSALIFSIGAISVFIHFKSMKSSVTAKLKPNSN
jgi:hypothetical protein